jgi:transcription-repair coupling factor (superfamily II helicase)
VDEVPGLEALRKEMRDRFGPIPPAIELLMLVKELKLMAGQRGITSIEVKDDKIMLTRNNDYVMVGNKFPRLTRKASDARLKEIKRLLSAL